MASMCAMTAHEIVEIMRFSPFWNRCAGDILILNGKRTQGVVE